MFTGLRSKNHRLESREERLALTPKERPFWHHYGNGRHLGYRRIEGRNGRWVARYTRRASGRSAYYCQQTFGGADDYTGAMGHSVLTFGGALEKAKPWTTKHSEDAIPLNYDASTDRLIYCSIGNVYTVGHAAVDHFKFAMMYRKAPRSIMYKFNRYILPHLGPIPAEELTAEDIKDWLEMIAKTPARRGSGEPIENPTAEDLRRRYTANGVFASLRAALNFAFREGKISSDVAWRRVTKYPNVLRSRTRYLELEEVRSMLAAAEPDYRNFILGALYTGCRGGELTSMTVGAYDPKLGKVFVDAGKSAPRWIPLPEESIPLFRKLSSGRNQNELLFLRDGDRRWTSNAYQSATVQTRKKAGLSDDVTLLVPPYVRLLSGDGWRFVVGCLESFGPCGRPASGQMLCASQPGVPRGYN